VITDAFLRLFNAQFLFASASKLCGPDPIPVAFVNEVIICIALIAAVVPAFCPSLF